MLNNNYSVGRIRLTAIVLCNKLLYCGWLTHTALLETIEREQIAQQGAQLIPHPTTQWCCKSEFLRICFVESGSSL
jgi:hypothetical protein